MAGTDFSIPGNAPHIQTNNFENELSSGDLVLFSGKGSFFSYAIRAIQSPLQWTHVGILVRNPNDQNRLYVFQSTNEKQPPNHYHQHKGFKTGPKLTPINDVIHSYRGYAIAFRKLQHQNRGSQIFDSLIWAYFQTFFQEHGHKSYEQNSLELLGAAYSLNRKSNLTSFFCTELIAEFLMHCGLLSEKWQPSNNYNLWHFSEGIQLPLLGGYQFSPEIFLYHQ